MTTRRLALITGGGTGIGAAIAHRMAAEGWDLAISFSRSVEQAEATAELCRALGAGVRTLQGDVALDGDCRRMVDAAVMQHGRLDALVNSAGTTKFCDRTDLDGLTSVDFERVFAVNVTGAYQVTRAAAPALRAARGAILNVSSQAGFSGVGSSTAYAASKAALNNLTLALARTLAPEVRVNAVCPGFVNTRWAKRSLDDEQYQRFRRGVEAMTPLARMAEPEDVADVAYFLLTTRAPITGELLGVDGGNHLTVNVPAPGL